MSKSDWATVVEETGWSAQMCSAFEGDDPLLGEAAGDRTVPGNVEGERGAGVHSVLAWTQQVASTV
jgi:hypothetical protein